MLSGHQSGSNWMASVVTLAVLIAALYIIVARAYDDGTQKWAFAAIGSIVTFWLRR